MNENESEKQEQQIDLIHKFLIKASVNLTHPIEVVIPKKSLPMKDRKTVLAQQLNDFVRVYTKETNILMEREGPASDSVVLDNSFHTFIKQAR